MNPYIIILVAITMLHGAATDYSRADSLDDLYSTKALGCIVDDSTTTFRLFAPRALSVRLVLYETYHDEPGTEIEMERDRDGVWEYQAGKVLYGKFYGYRVDGPSGNGEMFNPRIVVADPYSRVVATKNTFRHQGRTLILDTRYDWEGDTFVAPADHNSLVIYEAHVRDLTMHPSAKISAKGTYAGLTEKGKPGGLSHLKDLGINAIELLPIQDFANIELPFHDSTIVKEGYQFNTWNPYERNHWGYMTSYFFAPETYYATDGTMDRGKVNGTDGRAVRELKDMVKSFHREGIAVIMDVVYNHVSQYDQNPYKYIDKKYYFRCDTAGNFITTSGCGNDFKTERPMARRMIVESVLYWMKEFHIDGFRFDLATMIDWETCEAIAREARTINPNVVLIAEAWGGGKYDPPGFSRIGWAAWNDQIRNGVKGQNPKDGLGFIFGKFQGGNSAKSFRSFVTGTLAVDGGMFQRKEHSVNYLESHDDNTMGDFIRLGTGEVREGQVITDPDRNAKLSARQAALNKLAALYLFVSQGPVMIHEGQEFARSKVIARSTVPDAHVGRIDHNSYEKDDETNYLNYKHKTMNRSLYSYYKGLIGLRKTYPVFANASAGGIEFIRTGDEHHLAFRIEDDSHEFYVVLNGNQQKRAKVELPEGEWTVLVNGSKANVDGSIGVRKGNINVAPVSGVVLMKSKASGE